MTIKARVNLDLIAFAVTGLHQQNGKNFGKIECASAAPLDLHIPIPMTVREHDKHAYTGIAGSLTPEKEAEYDAILRTRQTAEVNDFIRIVRSWLDQYDVLFSGTEVSYGRHQGFENKGEFLRIKITPTPEPKREEPILPRPNWRPGNR